jgi:hypothetical protein
MRFYLKEWPDDTVTLMTETGRIIWTFDSVEDAIAGLNDWEPPVARMPLEVAPRKSKPALNVAA